MKNLLFTVILMLGFAGMVTAQTDQGAWVLEVNTNLGSDGNNGNTGISFSSSDTQKVFNWGTEAGYFVADNFAIKGGLGYGSTTYEYDTDKEKVGSFSYKLGSKYYINGMVPIELALSGSVLSGDTADDLDTNPLYLGGNIGYAIFFADNVAIEPAIGYNYSINKDADLKDGGTVTDFFESQFVGSIGFSLFFNN